MVKDKPHDCNRHITFLIIIVWRISILNKRKQVVFVIALMFDRTLLNPETDKECKLRTWVLCAMTIFLMHIDTKGEPLKILLCQTAAFCRPSEAAVYSRS